MSRSILYSSNSRNRWASAPLASLCGFLRLGDSFSATRWPLFRKKSYVTQVEHNCSFNKNFLPIQWYSAKNIESCLSPPTTTMGWKGLKATEVAATRRRCSKLCTHSGRQRRRNRSYTYTRPSSVTATNTLLLKGDQVTPATAPPTSSTTSGALYIEKATQTGIH